MQRPRCSNVTPIGATMSSEIFKNAFSQGPVVIFVWESITGEWPVSEVSENVEELTGWPPKSFLDGEINYADLIHPDDLEHVSAEEAAWKEQLSRTGVNIKYRIVSRTGEIRHVSEFTQNVFEDDGTVNHLVGYIVDVTEHYESEEARRAAELAEKVEVRVSGQYEPRDPHPDERHYRNGGIADEKCGLDDKQDSFREDNSSLRATLC